MAKIHPDYSPPCSTNYMTASTREIFTLWMKSLVFHGNGCTVYDSSGGVIYRIDNYEGKSSREVYLMDLRGKVLFSIRRKRLSVLGAWDGYNWMGSQVREDRPWFQVRKNYNFNSSSIKYHVSLGCDRAKARSCYRIVELVGKSAFNITDSNGKIIAEVRQKQLSSGVLFGDDVLSLVVEPQTDHSLVMALVTVYGLIKNKI